jgi:Flp pilus assembly protein TadD
MMTARWIFWLTLPLCAAGYSQESAAMAKARQSYELARAGNLEQAAAVMREAIALEPANALLHSALGGILARQDKREEARSSFAEAVRLDPANTVLRLQLARLQMQTGQWEPAYENLRQVDAAQPGNAEVRALLEEAACELGAEWARARRFKAGQALARDAARRFPDSARVHEMLGLFETRNQENVLAVEAYRKARELAPDSAGAAAGLAIAQAAAGMTADAAATLENALGQFPKDATLRQVYGVLLLKWSETDPARRAKGAALLEEALALDPGLAEAHYQLGNLALGEGRAQEAVERLEAALRNGERSSRVWFALARAYRRAGRAADAEAALERFRAQKAEEEKTRP